MLKIPVFHPMGAFINKTVGGGVPHIFKISKNVPCPHKYLKMCVVPPQKRQEMCHTPTNGQNCTDLSQNVLCPHKIVLQRVMTLQMVKIISIFKKCIFTINCPKVYCDPTDNRNHENILNLIGTK